MQPTVSTELDNPRISVTPYIRGLLERLAETARFDWFLLDTRRRSTLTGEQVTSLAKAFTRENLHAFDDEEIFEILSWYDRLHFDTYGMSREIIAYFRKPGHKAE